MLFIQYHPQLQQHQHSHFRHSRIDATSDNIPIRIWKLLFAHLKRGVYSLFILALCKNFPLFAPLLNLSDNSICLFSVISTLLWPSFQAS